MIPVPEKIDRYIVRGTLGQGAMGVVYKALDPTIDRVVAVKAIRDSEFRANPDGEEMEARFRREIHTAGLLTHSNIVTVYDGGKDGDTHWIAMEFVDGPSLSTLIKENERIPVQATLDVMTKVCEAIDFAHRKNVIHRDLKPGNILLTSEGEPKLADFGIARIESSTMTQTGVILGTPSYMSPEQVKGKSIDNRSDLFSLGVILYEMLAARRPFKGDSPTSIMYQIVHEEVRPPHVFNKEVPVQLSRVVMKALAKKPADRYQKASEMAADLREIRDGGNLETTIRGFDSALETAEIRSVPDIATLSHLQAEDDSSMSTMAKVVVMLLVLATITAGAYYSYLFFADQINADMSSQESIPRLNQAVITASLSISANVPEAKVFLKGEQVGYADGTPIPLNGTAGSEHTIEVFADCYEKFEESILLDSDEPLNRQIELVRKRKKISITSAPEGADIFIGDELLGQTPLEYDLECGVDTTLRVEKSGFHPKAQALSWQGVGDDVELAMQLERFKPGTLEIVSSYPVMAQTGGGDRLQLDQGHVTLQPGTYNIRLTNTEYFLNTTRTVEIPEDGKATIDDLPALGEIWIREIPVHDGVAVVEGFAGKEMPLPVMEKPIAIGNYTIVIRWPDGEQIERQVQIKAGEPFILNVRKGAG